MAVCCFAEHHLCKVSQNRNYAGYHYAECHYAECLYADVFFRVCYSHFTKMMVGHHDTQRNDIQHNDIGHNKKKSGHSA
jgi:hypothetical protein